MAFQDGSRVQGFRQVGSFELPSGGLREGPHGISGSVGKPGNP